MGLCYVLMQFSKTFIQYCPSEKIAFNVHVFNHPMLHSEQKHRLVQWFLAFLNGNTLLHHTAAVLVNVFVSK